VCQAAHKLAYIHLLQCDLHCTLGIVQKHPSIDEVLAKRKQTKTKRGGAGFLHTIMQYGMLLLPKIMMMRVTMSSSPYIVDLCYDPFWGALELSTCAAWYANMPPLLLA
jgi:hypothetical protein